MSYVVGPVRELLLFRSLVEYDSNLNPILYSTSGATQQLIGPDYTGQPVEDIIGINLRFQNICPSPLNLETPVGYYEVLSPAAAQVAIWLEHEWFSDVLTLEQDLDTDVFPPPEV